MSREARIAVVIPCFELGHTLEEAVDSALEQTRLPSEVVVVDDGSRDLETRQVLSRLKRPRTRIVLAEHGGVAEARNRGVRASTADYVVLLDADDVLAETWLERAASRLDADPGLDFVSCSFQAFGEAQYVWRPPAVDAVGTLTRGSVHVSSMFRRRLFDAVGGFDPELAAYEDLDFWLRAIVAGHRGIVLDEVQLFYRVRAGSRYRQGIEPATYQAALARIIDKHGELLRTRGIEVLKSKESFLVQVLDYQDQLKATRTRLLKEIAEAEGELAALPAAPGAATPPGPPAAPDVPRRRWYRRTAPGAAARPGLILAWHRIASLDPDTHGLCESPEHFAAQLAFLKEHCTPLSLDDFVAASREGALPPRAVALTFDDGYLDALANAAPLLVEAGIPATFFVNTERLEEPHEAWHDILERVLLGEPELPARVQLQAGPERVDLDLSTPASRRQALMQLHGPMLRLDAAGRAEVVSAVEKLAGRPLPPREDHRVLLAEEIRALASQPGITIGSHSESHLWLPDHPREVQRAEVQRAKARLEALVDAPVSSFCYPFGALSAELAQIAREASHRHAVTVEPGLVSAETDPFLLPRVEIASTGPSAFAAKVLKAFGGQSEWRANDALLREAVREQRIVVAARPQFLIIDPTSRCNARCVMCPVSFRAPGDHGTDLSASLFDKVAPLIPAASHVNLFASGEPTLAPQLPAMLTAVRERAASHAQLWTSTNGKALSPELVDALIERGFDLQFSVDGGTREVFEAIRRGVRFEDLLRSLELVSARRGGGGRPRLSFSCAMSKRNIRDLGSIFALAAKYRVDQVLFYDVDPESPEETATVLDEGDRPLFESQLASIEATGVRYSNGLSFRGARRGSPSRGPVHCTAPWRAFALRAEGEVRACCTLRESMGDLSRGTFDDVWNGEAYRRLRTALVEQRGIPEACFECTDPLRTWTGS